MPDTLPAILRGMYLGSQLKIAGTPTVIIEGTMYRDVPTEAELERFVASALSHARK